MSGTENSRCRGPVVQASFPLPEQKFPLKKARLACSSYGLGLPVIWGLIRSRLLGRCPSYMWKVVSKRKTILYLALKRTEVVEDGLHLGQSGGLAVQP